MQSFGCLLKVQTSAVWRSRGAVAGRLILCGHPDQPESAMDCSSFGTQGVPFTINNPGILTNTR